MIKYIKCKVALYQENSVVYILLIVSDNAKKNFTWQSAKIKN